MVSIGSRVVLYVLLCFSIFDFVVTMVSSFGTKRLQIFTASFKSPPGFPLKSRIILSAPSFFSCSRASLVSKDAFLLNCDKTIYPVLSSIFPKKGTAFISTSSKTICVLSVLPCRRYFMATLVFFAPFNN